MTGSAGNSSSYALSTANSTGRAFADHFWSKDKKGLEIILNQMAKSSRTCDSLARIFEKRAQIEEEYGEKLLKLSQISLPSDETFTFSDAFRAVPGAARTAGETHIKLAQDIKDMLEYPLADFVEKQKREREAAVEIINYDYQSRLLHLENVDRARRAYVLEYDKLLKSRRTGSNKDGMMQSSQPFDVADQEYKHAVEICSANSQNWINDWKSACNTFQALEKDYLMHLVRALSTYSRLSSDVYLSDDQSYERICTGLDNVDIRKDLDNFIIKNGTGEKPSGIPKYNKLEPPLTPEPSAIESALSERSVREVNIPVADEELRSVNEQLKKLPSQMGKAGSHSQTKSDLGQSMYKASSNAEENRVSETRSTPVLALDFVPNHSLVNSQTTTPVSAKIASPATDISPHDKALPAVPQPTTRKKSYLLEAMHPHQHIGDDVQILRRWDDKTSTEQYDKCATTSPIADHPHLPANGVTSDSPQTKGRRHTTQSSNFTGDARNTTYPKPATISTARPPTWYNEVMDPSSPFRFSTNVTPKDTKPSSGERKKWQKFFPISFRKRKTHKKTMEGQSAFPDELDRRHHSTIGMRRGEQRSMTLQMNSTNSNFQDPGSRFLNDGTPVLEYAQAAWDYNAKIETEMSFSKNDVLAIISKNNDGWWLAEIVSGHYCPRGLVPSNFMRPLSHL